VLTAQATQITDLRFNADCWDQGPLKHSYFRPLDWRPTGHIPQICCSFAVTHHYRV